jgi:hypothetical protein
MGEIALVTEGVRTASIRAVTCVEMSVLSKQVPALFPFAFRLLLPADCPCYFRRMLTPCSLSTPSTCI